jgi:hypothetical protein
MRRQRNKSGGGDSLVTLLLAGAGAYFLYEWYTSNYSTQVTIGTTAAPITVPGVAPVLAMPVGPLPSVPVGPGVSNSAGNVNLDVTSTGVAGYFDSTGMW